MKNDSPRFPFETPVDDFFDINKDGKLIGSETVFRDSHLEVTDSDFIPKQQKSYSNKNSGGAFPIWSFVILILFILWLFSK